MMTVKTLGKISSLPNIYSIVGVSAAVLSVAACDEIYRSIVFLEVSINRIYTEFVFSAGLACKCDCAKLGRRSGSHAVKGENGIASDN